MFLPTIPHNLNCGWHDEEMKQASCRKFILGEKESTARCYYFLLEMINNELNCFQPIPKELIFDKALSMDARFVYCYIASKNTSCDFKLQALSQEIGCDLELLQSCLSELIARGWLCGKFDVVDGAKCASIMARKVGVSDPQPTFDTKEKANDKKDDSMELFEKCWVAYRRKGSKKIARQMWVRLSDNDKKMVLPHIQAYVKTRELKFQSDFERYLRNKTFENIVISGNITIYDPKADNANEYRPTADGALIWSEEEHCYLYIGFYHDGMTIYDGYDDRNRPDGARIVLNNARGIIVWSSSKQKWEKEQ